MPILSKQMMKPKIMFIATTDSYLKWANSLREELPRGWNSSICIAKSLQNPSTRQIEVALGKTQDEPLVSKHVLRIIRDICKEKPDSVFVGGTGPFLAVFRWLLNFSPRGRQIKLISGSPGIAFHLDGAPLKVRSAADLILVASKRERTKLGKALEGIAPKTKIALSGLSFLHGLNSVRKFPGEETLVFAPQPDMPKSRADREKILIELAALKRMHPSLKIVIKLRAIDQEPQTHFEEFPYQVLTQELESIGVLKGNEFSFELGSIVDQMKNSNAALLTLSSTAALESIAMGSPTQIISDFGLHNEIANMVFEDSGLVHPIADYGKAVRAQPASGWLTRNYFHDEHYDDWQTVVAELFVETRDHNFSILPKELGLFMFVGETLRVLAPNALGASLIRALKIISARA